MVDSDSPRSRSSPFHASRRSPISCGLSAKKAPTISGVAWPPKNSQVDYSKGARRQLGVIEAITWESLLRGGVEIGEKVVLSSPSMGENWEIIVKKISHRFSTRDSQTRTTSWEGIIA